MAITVDDVLARLKTLRGFERIRRFRYKIDIAEAMMVIETIGKEKRRKFCIDEDNRFAYENFVKWCNGDESMQCLDPVSGAVIKGDIHRGIYIAGGTGTGKSWCLDIVRLYCNVMHLKVNLGSDYEDKEGSPLWWRTERADAICEVFMQTGDVGAFKRCEMLGIQDLGSEPIATLYMGNRVEVLKYLLESRGDDMDKMTFITSNIGLADESLSERYGDRVSSRLREMCNYLEIRGRDRRL